MEKPSIWLESQVDFTCPNCCIEISTTIIIPEVDDTDGRLPHAGEASLFCNVCDARFTAVVLNSGTEITVTIPDHATVAISAGAAFYRASPGDEWYDEPPPEDPHGRFIETVNQLRNVLNLHGSKTDGSDIVNRMVFSQHISAFEAYLADTLVRNVIGDPSAIRRLLVEDENLKTKKVSLAAVFDEPEIVMKEVRSHLRTVVYHKTDRVSRLYSDALGVKFVADKADATALADAIKDRHHCVHRNGRDFDGEQLQIFTPGYIEEIAEILSKFVSRVESAVSFRHVAEVIAPAQIDRT